MKQEHGEKLTALVQGFQTQYNEARKNMDWCEDRIKQLERVLDANPAFHSQAVRRSGQSNCEMINHADDSAWEHGDVPFSTSIIFTKRNIYIRVSDYTFMLLGEIG